jgi:GT2 family glycosyltransferase
MITVIYSTHKDSNYNIKFKQHLLQSAGLKDIQILEYQNNNQYSLAQIYNSGITESKYNIVVCCHNDIKLENGWGKKLLRDFESNPDFGIIGKAGSCYFPESGIYWERMQQTMVGQVYHHPDGQKKWLSRYSPKLPFLVPVVTVDGLFISFDITKIKHTFDETIGKFHFYDHLFCLPNYLDGVKIGVTSSFEITHQSVGHPNQEFFDSKVKFLEKFGNKLPIDLKPNFPYVTKLNKKNIKKFGKVAVIIPTKSNINLLFNCILSFENNCDSNFYDIFIADTGSSEVEKTEIKNFISEKTNIKLIEYDYYNFGKINNDVVKNYVSDSYEYLMFCNNDIILLNDVILEMLNVIKFKQNCGTVGARLHFNDNTIQHCGIIAGLDSKNSFLVTHIGLTNYYNYTINTNEVFGNTAALLMIRKNVFEKCGYFNETYTDCFEDVELNIKCLSLGLSNYFVGSAVAYHLESQTRNLDPYKINKLMYDYHNNLVPCVLQNLNKIKKHLIKFN